MRVGDEHEVELLQGRLPNATSAAAVVEGHIIEVENAANNAGNTARIRILDVDDKDDYVLAEMITAGVAADKKKRRRGGRRKTELTATEQAKQLRELAEEAARFTASRAPIGITSVTEEEEAEDQELLAERRGEKQVDAIIIAEGEVQRSEGDASTSAAAVADAAAAGAREAASRPHSPRRNSRIRIRSRTTGRRSVLRHRHRRSKTPTRNRVRSNTHRLKAGRATDSVAGAVVADVAAGVAAAKVSRRECRKAIAASNR